MTLDEAKRKAVLEALARRKGNKVRTADDLDISLKTLYNLLARYRREGHVTADWWASIRSSEAVANA